jgi:hypothetical protein
MISGKRITPPLRNVTVYEWTGACRYTGYQNRTIKLTLECGHHNYRKASQGAPQRARCRECAYIAAGIKSAAREG